MFVLVTLFRFLCGKLTFIFVSGVRVWVSAQYSVCVSCVALDDTMLLGLIHRGFSRNICVVRNKTSCPTFPFLTLVLFVWIIQKFKLNLLQVCCV